MAPATEINSLKFVSLVQRLGMVAQTIRDKVRFVRLWMIYEIFIIKLIRLFCPW